MSNSRVFAETGLFQQIQRYLSRMLVALQVQTKLTQLSVVLILEKLIQQCHSVKFIVRSLVILQHLKSFTDVSFCVKIHHPFYFKPLQYLRLTIYTLHSLTPQHKAW